MLKETDFAWKVKNRRRQSCCSECIRKKIKDHYYKNKSSYVRRAKERSLKAKKFVHDYLSTHPCVDCNESDPVVLEFDHLRDKKWSISQGLKSKQSIKTLSEEIAKCEVRCSNCHKRKTAKEQSWYHGL